MWTVISHSFQGGVGGRDKSFKMGVSQGRGATPITDKVEGSDGADVKQTIYQCCQH